MATATAQTAEQTSARNLLGLRMIRQHFTAVANGETYDFGVGLVAVYWLGDAVTDRATVGIATVTSVAFFEDETGTVEGTVIAFAKDA